MTARRGGARGAGGAGWGVDGPRAWVAAPLRSEHQWQVVQAVLRHAPR